jgi:hypothetical protein
MPWCPLVEQDGRERERERSDSMCSREVNHGMIGSSLVPSFGRLCTLFKWIVQDDKVVRWMTQGLER